MPKASTLRDLLKVLLKGVLESYFMICNKVSWTAVKNSEQFFQATNREIVNRFFLVRKEGEGNVKGSLT